MSLFKCLSKNISFVQDQEEITMKPKCRLISKHKKRRSTIEERKPRTSKGTGHSLGFNLSKNEDTLIPVYSSVKQATVSTGNRQPRPCVRTSNSGSPCRRICSENPLCRQVIGSIMPANISVTNPFCTDDTISNPTSGLGMLCEYVSLDTTENAVTNLLAMDDSQIESISGTLNRGFNISTKKRSGLFATEPVCNNDTISKPISGLLMLREYASFNSTANDATIFTVCKDDSQNESISGTLNKGFSNSPNSESARSKTSSVFITKPACTDGTISSPTFGLSLLREYVSFNTTENTVTSITVCEDDSQTDSITGTLNNGFDNSINIETTRSKKSRVFLNETFIIESPIRLTHTSRSESRINAPPTTVCDNRKALHDQESRQESDFPYLAGSKSKIAAGRDSQLDYEVDFNVESKPLASGNFFEITPESDLVEATASRSCSGNGHSSDPSTTSHSLTKYEYIRHLVSLELDYINYMNYGMKKYSRPLRHSILSGHQSITVFQNIKKLVTISEYLIKGMQENASTSIETDKSQVDEDLFLYMPAILYDSKIQALCHEYESYARGLDRANALLLKMKKNKAFKNFIKDTDTRSNRVLGRLSIIDFINKPVLHIQKLYISLNEIFTTTPLDSPDFVTLKLVVDKLSECLKTVARVTPTVRINNLETDISYPRTKNNKPTKHDKNTKAFTRETQV